LANTDGSQGKPKPKFPIWLRVVLGIIGAIVLVSGFMQITHGSNYSGQLAACDSDESRDLLKQAIEQNSSWGDGVRILDMGNLREVHCPAVSNANGSCMQTGKTDRYCNGQLYLTTGGINAKFRIFFGPSGELLLEVQQGSWTDWSGGRSSDNIVPAAPAAQQIPASMSEVVSRSSTDNPNSDAIYAVENLDNPKARKIPKCILEVEGKSYINAPCVFVPSDHGGFSIYGYNNWFAMIDVQDGIPSGRWNNDDGFPASHAQDELGPLVRKGACFVGPRSRVCAIN
jgi:hypothetical protein